MLNSNLVFAYLYLKENYFNFTILKKESKLLIF